MSEICTCRDNDPCYFHKGVTAVSGSVVMPPAEKKNSLTGYADIDAFLNDVLDTMRVKGHDYRQGNDDDLLHNFRTVGESVSVPMEKVWFTYFYKHYSALATYIKEGGQQESEPIESRVKDMIVYLLLFYKMVKEQRTPKEPVYIFAPSYSPPEAVVEEHSSVPASKP